MIQSKSYNFVTMEAVKSVKCPYQRRRAWILERLFICYRRHVDHWESSNRLRLFSQAAGELYTTFDIILIGPHTSYSRGVALVIILGPIEPAYDRVLYINAIRSNYGLAKGVTPGDVQLVPNLLDVFWNVNHGRPSTQSLATVSRNEQHSHKSIKRNAKSLKRGWYWKEYDIFLKIWKIWNSVV